MNSSDRLCSRCGDVVMYCTCPYTDPVVVDDKDYMDSPSFEIYRGDQKAEWDRQTRSLSGDAELVQEIRSHLTGEYVEVLYPEFSLWMTHKDPFAVHYVASEFVKGCRFSKSVPDWSPFTDPDVVY